MPEMRKYVATRAFTLGDTGLQIGKGDELLWDGSGHVEYCGDTFKVPRFRGAMKIGWVVKADDFDPNDRTAEQPIRANIQLRPADGGNPMDPAPRKSVATTEIDEEEQRVMSVSQHASNTRENNKENYRRKGSYQSGGYVGGNLLDGATSTDGEVTRVVRKVSTPAKSYTDIDKAGEAMAKAQNVRIQPGEIVRTRDDVMADLDPEDRAAYEADLRSHAPIELPERKVVGAVKSPGTRESEGITVAGSVGRGVETSDLGGTTGKAETQVVEEEGIRFTTTNGPKKQTAVVRSENDNQCRRIARAVCSDFPDNYVFDDSPRKKIARLQADYEDRPDVIRAVAAAETDPDFRSKLIAEFPDAFA